MGSSTTSSSSAFEPCKPKAETPAPAASVIVPPPPEPMEEEQTPAGKPEGAGRPDDKPDKHDKKKKKGFFR